MIRRLLAFALTFFSCTFAFAQDPAAGEDRELEQQLQAIAAALHGKVALYAENLKTGQSAGLAADEPVKTASTIKMAILLDAAEQIRAGHASFGEKLVLSHENQVEGSGVLGELDTPLALTLRDTLTLMVVLSDNTATNMAIDRLGLARINDTLKAAGLKQSYLYKKVYVPATGPMPADQPRFGLGKTTAREMAQIMARLAQCRLALDGSAAGPGDGAICATILHMLRNQQDRDGIPRYLEFLDTSEHGSAIANKTGALDALRADVALIASKAGPVVIAAYTYDNADQRWNGDNEGQQTLGKLAKAVLERWSPGGIDPASFDWENPLLGPGRDGKGSSATQP
ncbi:serine hydrolase [Acidobacteria bacterium AB60]|nr:serine hydrolase [Acidobacteria bacterium AB60]